LQYTLPESDSYFSQRTTFTVQSERGAFIARPLPVAGQPVGFSGAVGRFVDSMYTDGSVPRVGDAFTLTVRVAGVGNVSLLPRPEMRLPWANVVNGEERATWDSSGSLVRGAKEFDWTVTPTIAGDLFIPALRYDFFDPTTEQYAFAMTQQIPLAVRTAGTTAGDTARRRRETIAETPFPLLLEQARAHWPFVVGIGVVLIALVGWAVVRATRTPPADD
jgi:hypothetical protein